MVKIAHKYAEAARVAVRHVRRDALDLLKKLEKDGKISEDDHTRMSGEGLPGCAHLGKAPHPPPSPEGRGSYSYPRLKRIDTRAQRPSLDAATSYAYATGEGGG